MGQFPIMIVQPSTPQPHQNLSSSTVVINKNNDKNIENNGNSSGSASVTSVSPPPALSPHTGSSGISSAAAASYAPLVLSPNSSILPSQNTSALALLGNNAGNNYQLTAAEKSSVDAMLQHFAQNFSNNIVQQQQQQQQQQMPYISPFQLLQHQDAQNTSIMDKIKQLENVIVQQNTLVSQLLGNFCINSAPKIEGVLPAKWAPLLQVCEVILTIRDKKTMKLLGYNQTYMKFLKTKNVGAPMCEAEPFKKINDTWMILILLTLIRDTIENRVETRFQKLSCKSLLNFAPDCVTLVQSTVHFEDPDVFWIECREVVSFCCFFFCCSNTVFFFLYFFLSKTPKNPPIYDDAFTLGEFESPATQTIMLPLHEPEKARQMYETVSKARFYKQIALMLANQNKTAINLYSNTSS